MSELKCHVQETRLGQVWKYHISWYEDPDKLDNVVMVRSRPRDGANRLEVSTWTGEKEVAPVLYVKVRRLSVGSLSLSDVTHLRCLLPGCLWSGLRSDSDYFISATMELIVWLARA